MTDFQAPQPEAAPMPDNPLAGAVCSVAEARGYVAFGAGVYRVCQTVEPGLVVTFRRPGEEDRAVSERAEAPDLTPIPPEDMIVRLQFTSAAGLDSLEDHLREIRAEHWPETVGGQSAKQWLDQRKGAASKEWMAGWDACRAAGQAIPAPEGGELTDMQIQALQPVRRALVSYAKCPMDQEATLVVAQVRAALAAQPLPTRSQRMREAGYTRRPSWKSLPSDADDVQQDGWNEPYNCIAAGPTATDVALHQAMNEAAKVGNRDDDKLIRKALNDAGYYLVRSMKKPGTCEHMLAVPDVQAPAEGALTDEQIDAMLSDIDDIARNVDFYEFGLPIADEPRAAMREAVRAAIASKVQPKGTAASVPEWKREARQAAEGKQAYYRDMMRQAREAREDAQAPAPVAELTNEQIDEVVNGWFNFPARGDDDFRARMRRALSRLPNASPAVKAEPVAEVSNWCAPNSHSNEPENAVFWLKRERLPVGTKLYTHPPVQGSGGANG